MASSMLKSILGYPFSISKTFRCGIHKTIAESLVTLDEILEIADKTRKWLLFSMGLEIHTAILGT
jgi:hypothetical protein